MVNIDIDTAQEFFLSRINFHFEPRAIALETRGDKINQLSIFSERRAQTSMGVITQDRCSSQQKEYY